MARSIGKIKIKKIKVLVTECMKKPSHSFQGIVEKIPEEYFNTWEGAYSEINRIVMDTIFETNAKK